MCRVDHVTLLPNGEPLQFGQNCRLTRIEHWTQHQHLRWGNGDVVSVVDISQTSLRRSEHWQRLKVGAHCLLKRSEGRQHRGLEVAPIRRGSDPKSGLIDGE